MYSFFMKLSRFMAILGGVMLVGLILLTCTSVLGRWLNGVLHSDFITAAAPGVAAWVLGLGIGPVNGDFELIEAGIAFSIFAFMPICTLTGGHASVDIFTQRMSASSNRILRLITAIVFSAVFVLIAVQLFAGMQSKRGSGQTTFLIEFPIWWAYVLSLLGAVVAAIVAVYIAFARIGETLSGRDILPKDLGANN